MEPRARVGRNRGQQNFTDQELTQFLYGNGDTSAPLDTTKRVLDEILTDFVTELCFEAQRHAQLAGRQKIKLDDIRFACRKHPTYLGKMEHLGNTKNEIDRLRKTFDTSDDKISKSDVKGVDEPLGKEDDNDMDVDVDDEMKPFGSGRSIGKGKGK